MRGQPVPRWIQAMEVLCLKVGKKIPVKKLKTMTGIKKVRIKNQYGLNE